MRVIKERGAQPAWSKDCKQAAERGGPDLCSEDLARVNLAEGHVDARRSKQQQHYHQVVWHGRHLAVQQHPRGNLREDPKQ